MAAMTAQQRQLYLSDLMAGQSDPENQAVLDQVPMSSLIGQIPGNYGQGQGAFQRSGGNRIDLTPQGWQDSSNQQMLVPKPQSGSVDYGYGLRPDGTPKGRGFLGELKRPDGGVSTELSIGVNLNGKETDIPTLVPTLTPAEVNSLLRGERPSDAIVQKAVDHARSRLSSGRGVFADDIVSQQPAQQSPQIDYSQPLDFMGSKGYRLKGDSNRVLLSDGRMVTLDATAQLEQAARQRKAQLDALDLETKRADLANKQSGEWQAAANAGVMINKRTGEIKPIGSGQGHAPAGYRFKADGTMETIPGGPADMKASALAQQKAAGASDVDSAVATLRDAYDRLEKGGGITSTKKGMLDNLSASSSSSAMGQAVGKMFGTDNQSARNDIAMTRPALLGALMKATGMSAKQMDSNAELKLWLATATDPQLDVESNRRALANIERKYLGAQQPAASGGDSHARITDDAGYNALPSGATFIGPDGKTRRKP